MVTEEERPLTPKQQRWLEHLRQWNQTGETMSAYARREQISAQRFYQAASIFRKRGLWPEGTRAAGPQRPPTVPRPLFERVEVASERLSVRSWRARLPNGVRVEVSGDLTHDWVRSLAKL